MATSTVKRVNTVYKPLQRRHRRAHLGDWMWLWLTSLTHQPLGFHEGATPFAPWSVR